MDFLESDFLGITASLDFASKIAETHFTSDIFFHEKKLLKYTKPPQFTNQFYIFAADNMIL